MKDLFSVQGKTVVITGGSRGIGAMMARGFLENGADVYITARKIHELQATCEQLNQQGYSGKCVAIPCDLSELEGIKAFVAEFNQHETKLDVLINNAGAVWGAEISDFPEDGWDKVMNINVKSPFFLVQQFLPLLTQAASADSPARVINISSMNGITNPNVPNYSYSASNAAVIQMTRHLAADLAAKHINVNSIAPGLFPSKMTAFYLEGNEEQINSNIPLGRIGTPEDAAGTAIYLSSRASAWVTGHTLVLDGGEVAAAH
jgi:NAD(P)-dependent dehydrogenase (short-subunit alcohol dehydrogenase family)